MSSYHWLIEVNSLKEEDFKPSVKDWILSVVDTDGPDGIRPLRRLEVRGAPHAFWHLVKHVMNETSTLQLEYWMKQSCGAFFQSGYDSPSQEYILIEFWVRETNAHRAFAFYLRQCWERLVEAWEMSIQELSSNPKFSNPFLFDRSSMGHSIDHGWTLMRSGFDDPMRFAYLVNYATGRRFRLHLPKLPVEVPEPHHTERPSKEDAPVVPPDND